jgi:hypothetical protein
MRFTISCRAGDTAAAPLSDEMLLAAVGQYADMLKRRPELDEDDDIEIRHVFEAQGLAPVLRLVEERPPLCWQPRATSRKEIQKMIDGRVDPAVPQTT